MKNTLEIRTVNGVVETVIVTTDGVTVTEKHREWLSDEQVLEMLQKKKFYQHFKGTWQISFPQNYRVFQDPDFDKVVGAALRFIYERDNPSFCDDYIV